MINLLFIKSLTKGLFFYAIGISIGCIVLTPIANKEIDKVENLKNIIIKLENETKYYDQSLLESSNEYTKYLRNEGWIIDEGKKHLRFFIPTVNLFKIGDYKLSKTGEEHLKQLCLLFELNREQIEELIIEGHTDNLRISNYKRFKNNRELSFLRADGIARFFETECFSLNYNDITVIPYGSTKPVDEVNNSKNRRVEIIVKYK